MRKLMLLLMVVMMLVSMAVPSFALATTMADIFLAADITGLQTNVGTLLLGFVTISLLFVGSRYLKKAGIR